MEAEIYSRFNPERQPDKRAMPLPIYMMGAEGGVAENQFYGFYFNELFIDVSFEMLEFYIYEGKKRKIKNLAYK